MIDLKELICEKLRINRNINITGITPETKEEEACKELADICKETIFKNIELNDKDFYELNGADAYRIDDAFNKDRADDFFKKRSSILKAGISTAESPLTKSIVLTGSEIKNRTYVTLKLDNKKIDYILISKNMKDWLL